MTCPATTWDPRRKASTTCTLAADHAGPHDDGAVVWRDSEGSDSLRRRALDVVTREPWSTSTDVANELGVSVEQASTALVKLHHYGRVERRRMLGQRGGAFAYRVRA